MNKLDSRSAHTFHALQGASVGGNRFALVNIAAKGSRAIWDKAVPQSWVIDRAMRIIGDGGREGNGRNRVGGLSRAGAGVSCHVGRGDGKWKGGRG